MKSKFTKSVISGIASAIPSDSVDLTSLSYLYGTEEVKRIIASTGIEQVRVARDDQCTSDLCLAAAEGLLEKLEVPAETIDGIVFVSQTPDYKMPATSVLLQHRLGLRTTAAVFDINYGCSGFVYGLYQAAMMIEAAGYERVIVCSGDTSTRMVHPNDRSVRMVFGDGGSAALVEKGESLSHFSLRTDGSGAENLIIPAGGSRKPLSVETAIPFESEDGIIRNEETLRMNGMEIMSFALREVPPMIDELLHDTGWRKDEVGTFAFHQANKFMLEYLRKKMKLPLNSVPIAVANVGNTGPASIPMMLSLKHRVLTEANQLQKVICCGFGVGLSWASCSLNLSSTLILDPIEI
ncbi:3-oxoacyl-ACP synthase III family protein [Neobacillus sp. NPDC058068]|uniref:3-oxoacyl-ACP synthase III family protein n=1 Tax=Neobacillus sp. NPDC058068 TaxID=3346325 RepID=UPI0036D7A04C